MRAFQVDTTRGQNSFRAASRIVAVLSIRDRYEVDATSFGDCILLAIGIPAISVRVICKACAIGLLY